MIVVIKGSILFAIDVILLFEQIHNINHYYLFSVIEKKNVIYQ